MYWPKMDQDIEELVKSRGGCSLAAKTPPIRFQPWPKPNVPWSRIHIDLTGPLNGAYYLVLVDGYIKWPERLKCRKLTSTVAVNFLLRICCI